MAVNLFDVFVVGSTDPSAAGETRLAAALATKHGVPLPTVAKAIAAKNLRAGQGLEPAQAQALVKQLQSMGAVTVIRSAAGRLPANTGQVGRATGTSPIAKVSGVQPVASSSPSLSASSSSASSPAVSATAFTPGRPTPAAADGWSSTPAPLGGSAPLGGASSFAMPSVGLAGGDAFAPFTPSAAPDARDPFQPRQTATPAISTAKVRTPPPPHQSVPSSSGLALDVDPAPRLELERGGRREPDDEAPPRARSSMSPSSLREMDAGGKSGVAMDEDPKNLNLIRCVQHGLYYDKTKASGCRKCLAGARDFVNKLEQRDTAFRIADFRGKPAKRAFVGLTFALVLGFLPAAYYCFGPGGTDTHRLRLEQEVLSRQTGTEDNLRVFDDLDGQVTASHERASRNTAIVWVAVTGVAMLGWYKIT
jgi:hypothetical protein